MRRVLALCLLGCAMLQAQQAPTATELPGKPFYIKQTWMIGGEGNWDYLAVDPVALQLFVAHGSVVQVVDLNTGTLAGVVHGMSEAHGIALDESGEFGFASDGPARQVKVFDRRTFKTVASIPTGPSPRAIVFDPQNKLVFAVSAVVQPLPAPNKSGLGPASQSKPSQSKSAVTVIDAQTQTVLGTILLPGKLGFAQTGGRGQVYVIIADRNEVVRLDAQAMASRLQGANGANRPDSTLPPAKDHVLDLSAISPSAANSSVSLIRYLPLGPACRDPRSLAVDAANLRLFVACGNMVMVVLNADTGEQVASLPTGPGTDAIAYDANRGLIYAANGGGAGSLTVIRQSVTDSYAVIQNLPTLRRARTLAVNPATGEVYLVTDLHGVNLNRPGAIGTLRSVPVSGSFQVLVIGN